MNFYEAQVAYRRKKTDEINKKRSLFIPKDENNPAEYIRGVFNNVNRNFGVECDEKDAFSIFFCSAKEGEADVIFSVDTEISNVDEAKLFIKKSMRENYDIAGVGISRIKEITTEMFHSLGKKAENQGLIGNFNYKEGEMGCNFRENSSYRIKEEIISGKPLSLKEAIDKSKEFMPDLTFVEELERIFSDENEKKYYGNPVHYKLAVSNMDAATEMARLLCHALKVNDRLAGSRLSIINEITTNCYDESDFSNMFDMSKGNVVLFDLSQMDDDCGPYAGSYERVISYIEKIIKKNHVQTLCIFVENKNNII